MPSSPSAITPTDLADLIGARVSAGHTVRMSFDFDGTLSDSTRYPSESVVHPDGYAAVRSFQRLAGVDAFINSGRPLAFLAPKFPRVINLVCAYGLEGRTNGVAWQHPEVVKWEKRIHLFAARVAEVIAKAYDLDTVSFNDRESAELDAIFIEMKPAGFAIHDGPARDVRIDSASGETFSRTPAIKDGLLELLEGETFGFEVHENAGNTEFKAPLLYVDKDGVERPVDKAGVLDGANDDDLWIHFGDDSGDLPIARAIKERGGLIFVVRREATATRPGTPEELTGLADLAFDSVEQHAAFLNETASLMLGRALNAALPRGFYSDSGL